MYHEARRMEKAITQQMNQGMKRRDLARKEAAVRNAMKDPMSLLMVSGQRMRIHNDLNVTDETANLNKWQGDSSVLIDRFDARNLLDSIPGNVKPEKNQIAPANAEEFIERMELDYERYKDVILVDFKGEDDARVLQKISAPETKSKFRRSEFNKRIKKNTAPANAAVGFNYAADEGQEPDDENPIFSKPESSDSSEGEDDDLFSSHVGSAVFSTGDWQRLDKIAEKYHLPRDSFGKLFDVDRGEELDTARLTELERERIAHTGKGGKRDRARLRERKSHILRDPRNEDAVASLRSFAERRMRALKGENSTSDSDSDSEVEERTFCIVSVGEDEAVRPMMTDSKLARIEEVAALAAEDAEKFAGVRKLTALKQRRSMSPFGDNDWSAPVTVPSSAVKLNGDEASTECNAPKPTKEEDQSVLNDGKGWLRSRLSKLTADRQVRVRKVSASSSSDLGKSDDDAPVEIRSSMSESEKERLAIENRKRRIRRTKRQVKKKASEDRKSDASDHEAEKAAEAARKLREQLQQSLTKTQRELAVEEREKKTRYEEERRLRDKRSSSRSGSPASVKSRNSSAEPPSPKHRGYRRRRQRQSASSSSEDDYSRKRGRYRRRSRSTSRDRGRRQYDDRRYYHSRQHSSRRSRSRSPDRRSFNDRDRRRRRSRSRS